MEVSGQLPAALPPGKRAPGTHWIGSWVGPRTVLDAVVKRKIPSSRRETNPRTPTVQPVAQNYTDCRLIIFPQKFLFLKCGTNKFQGFFFWEEKYETLHMKHFTFKQVQKLNMQVTSVSIADRLFYSDLHGSNAVVSTLRSREATASPL
jgi:hypothetical protein